jgi:hypothetical protein
MTNITSFPSAVPDECCATGQSCSYAADGPNGERQCRYCGKPCECTCCLDESGETVEILGVCVSASSARMVLCATCGNKRCPHAADHRNECTHSNEPGQPGSNYPATAVAPSLNEATELVGQGHSPRTAGAEELGAMPTHAAQHRAVAGTGKVDEGSEP